MKIHIFICYNIYYNVFFSSKLHRWDLYSEWKSTTCMVFISYNLFILYLQTNEIEHIWDIFLYRIQGFQVTHFYIISCKTCLTLWNRFQKSFWVPGCIFMPHLISISRYCLAPGFLFLFSSILKKSVIKLTYCRCHVFFLFFFGKGGAF